jgi:hypothetical protein
MKPGDLVEIDYITADIFKIPCVHGGFVTGVVIENVFIHHLDKSLNCWSVFMNGQIIEFNEREIELVDCNQ